MLWNPCKSVLLQPELSSLCTKITHSLFCRHLPLTWLLPCSGNALFLDCNGHFSPASCSCSRTHPGMLFFFFFFPIALNSSLICFKTLGLLRTSQSSELWTNHRGHWSSCPCPLTPPSYSSQLLVRAGKEVVSLLWKPGFCKTHPTIQQSSTEREHFYFCICLYR